LAHVQAQLDSITGHTTGGGTETPSVGPEKPRKP
jgi:hypothetical protein